MHPRIILITVLISIAACSTTKPPSTSKPSSSQPKTAREKTESSEGAVASGTTNRPSDAARRVSGADPASTSEAIGSKRPTPNSLLGVDKQAEVTRDFARSWWPYGELLRIEKPDKFETVEAGSGGKTPQQSDTTRDKIMVKMLYIPDGMSIYTHSQRELMEKGMITIRRIFVPADGTLEGGSLPPLPGDRCPDPYLYKQVRGQEAKISESLTSPPPESECWQYKSNVNERRFLFTGPVEKNGGHVQWQTIVDPRLMTMQQQIDLTENLVSF